MTKKEKVCLEDSQVKRLAHDAFKMGKGINDDSICPTVKEIVDEAVPREERIGKASKKKKKERGSDVVEQFVTRRIKKALSDKWGKVTENFF